MRKPAIPNLVILFVFLLLLSCAKMEFPSGGPPDTTPPEILSSSPEPNQLNVPLDTEVRIQFSEKMVKNETPASLFIVPEPEEFPELHWKGEDLMIKFRNNLEENRTYLITIKTTLNDLHRNRLAAPYSLAFSTGPVLDTAWIAGMVYQEKRPVANVDVWAFPYDSNFVIYDKEPLYITQSTDTGNYRMGYMADGRYLTFAVRDKAGDRKFNPVEDMLGLPTRVASLDSLHPGIRGMNFVLSKFDTTALAVVSATYTNDLTVSIKFSANIFAPNLKIDNFIINRKGVDEPIASTDIYYYRDSTDRVMLITEALLEPDTYIIHARNVKALDGSKLSPDLDSASFEVSLTEDNEKPKVAGSYPSEEYEAFPTDTALEFYFSEPIMVDFTDTALLYLLAEDSTRFDRFSFSVEGITLYAQPRDSLRGGVIYSAFLNLQDIADRFGKNKAGDSSYVVNFATVNREDFGSVSGKFAGWDKYLMPRIFISSLDQKMVLPVVPDDSLRFLVELPSGRYSFYGYDDVNNNGKFDQGRVVPLEFAEPFFAFPDTISVRSRFETEGVNINLK